MTKLLCRVIEYTVAFVEQRHEMSLRDSLLDTSDHPEGSRLSLELGPQCFRTITAL